jgi:hypothetical protein
MTERDDGSMFGGHNARRKLGGPEIYSVARRAFTAGEPGKRTAKIRDVNVEVCGVVATLCSFNCFTSAHSYHRITINKYLSYYMQSLTPHLPPRSGGLRTCSLSSISRILRLAIEETAFSAQTQTRRRHSRRATRRGWKMGMVV